MKKSIILCADDYGQSTAISRGILLLIQQARLSAVSCMVTTPDWQQQAAWLHPYGNQIDIGLHVNFTYGKPLSLFFQKNYSETFFPLNRLLCLAFLHRLKQPALETECHAQIDCFEEKMGYLPRFLDGHQHIHQFPVIRDALLAVYKARLVGTGAYLRWVKEKWNNSWLGNIKKAIINSGANTFQDQLQLYQIPHNTSFAGIYPFTQASQYRRHFLYFLRTIKESGLIMCHPGLLSSQDVLSKVRYQELAYLSSTDFLLDCEAFNITIKRFYG